MGHFSARHESDTMASSVSMSLLLSCLCLANLARAQDCQNLIPGTHGEKCPDEGAEKFPQPEHCSRYYLVSLDQCVMDWPKEQFDFSATADATHWRNARPASSMTSRPNSASLGNV